MKGAFSIIANIDAKDGKAPEWVLVFKEGWNEVEGEGTFLVDFQAYEILAKNVERRGNDIVFDYEHQTLEGIKAPAAGWLKDLRYDKGVGIMARIDWTDEAALYIVKKEYRYFSPVFSVRKADQRVVGIHSIALTNAPKTNHLTPLLAKLGMEINLQKEDDLMDLKKLITKLGLAEDADEAQVLEAITELMDKKPETKAVETVAKDIITALGIEDGSDASTVVASIHALKQAGKGSVTQADFEKLQAKLCKRDADEIVSKALVDGKITPDQKEWAKDYAERDIKGFEVFVAKAPVVVPIRDLPGKKDEAAASILDDATQRIAKMMDVSADDIKKYG